MKKSLRVFYICILIIFLVLPIPFFNLVKEHVDTENYENRTLAAAPTLSLTVDSISAFPTAFENYFSDHLPFRNQLVYLNSYFNYHALHTSASDSVIVGKNGWLFYCGAQVNDEDPVADYNGSNLYSEEELQIIAANMQDACDVLAARGTEFVVMIAPNKERVYSEHMPAAYGEASTYGRMMQVADYLRANTTVPVVVAYDSIAQYREENPEQQIYFKYDTHWNNLGAYLGARALSSQLGTSLPELSDLTVTEGTVPTYDLANLLHLGEDLKDDPAPVIEGLNKNGLQVENNGGIEFRGWTTEGETDGRKLFIIGDSFSTLMFQYVACNFQNSYLNFYYNYSWDMIEEEQPQVVVYETVERYLNNMLHFSITDGIDADAE